MIVVKNISIVIIGAGSYGTALAISIARNGHNVMLWGHNPTHIKDLEKYRCNKLHLPNVDFPPSIYLETVLSKALLTSQNVLIAVPSQVFNKVILNLKFSLRKDTRIICATKGLEPNTGKLLHEIIEENLGNKIPIAIISGPTFAKELAIGLPTSIDLATQDNNLCNDLKKIFYCNRNFQIYASLDIIGVQLGGIIKNIIAIGVGIIDGIGLGSNAKAALITRSMKEMLTLGEAMGAQANTFIGMSGLGDLILTCTDNQSRNRRFGILIGRGISISKAKKKVGYLVEGLHNIKGILVLANKYKVKIPIIKQINQIIFRNKSDYQDILTLLGHT